MLDELNWSDSQSQLIVSLLSSVRVDVLSVVFVVTVTHIYYLIIILNQTVALIVNKYQYV